MLIDGENISEAIQIIEKNSFMYKSKNKSSDIRKGHIENVSLQDYVITNRPPGVMEAVISPHMTSSPGVTNDSLQFITCRQKRWRKRPA
jgi:hypothetical protein